MLKECTTEGVHIRPRVFDFADGSEDLGDSFEALPGKVADIVILDVLIGEALQMDEAGISIT